MLETTINKISKKSNNNSIQQHTSYLEALKKLEKSKILNDNTLKENKLLIKISSILPERIDDDITEMEITEINRNIYQQTELNVYSQCSKVNNFNLMKMVWDWSERLHKKINTFIDQNERKKDENAYKFQY